MAWGFPSSRLWRCVIPVVSKAQLSLERSGVTQQRITEGRNPQLPHCNNAEAWALTRFILVLSSHSLYVSELVASLAGFRPQSHCTNVSMRTTRLVHRTFRDLIPLIIIMQLRSFYLLRNIRVSPPPAVDKKRLNNLRWPTWPFRNQRNCVKYFVPLDPEASLVYRDSFSSVVSLAMWSKTPQRAFFVNLDERMIITGAKKAA